MEKIPEYKIEVFSPHLAKCLVETRKALAVNDEEEAWHWLYQIASPNFDKTHDEVEEFWKSLEIRATPISAPRCLHKNVTAEFMGGGFLRTCSDCGETLYG